MINHDNFATELRTIAEFEFDTRMCEVEEIRQMLDENPLQKQYNLLKLIYVAGAQFGSIKTLEMLKRDLKV